MLENPYEPPPSEANPRTAPNYMRIGSRVGIGHGLNKTERFCQVIAARDGYYLVFPGNFHSTTFAVYGAMISTALGFLLFEGWPRLLLPPVGGMIGAGLGAAFTALFPGQPEIGEVAYRDLPEAVRRHPDWPLKTLTSGRVIIVPRAAVKSITSTAVSTYDIDTDSTRYCVELGRLNRGRVISVLREMGWEFVSR